MIFPQRFKEHIVSYPLIAAAFEEFKINAREYHEGEAYKHVISNFMHGAFRCLEEPIVITHYGRLRLRTANIHDYDFIDAAERDEDTKEWVNNWSPGSRIEKFGDNNFFQTIIESTENNEIKPIGFIDFRDMLSDTQVELKRIAITEKGKGYGKKAMYLSQKFAFDVLGRNKLYLGTKDHNVRAQHVYHSTGFVLSDPESISRFHIMKQQEQN
jgi:RimJ/RimL family protein N-acetyltransferase